MGLSRRKSAYLQDTIIYVLLLGVAGGLAYYFFGDRLREMIEVRDVKVNCSVVAKIALKRGVEKQMKRSYLWGLYFKHLPPSKRQKKARPALKVYASFERCEPPGQSGRLISVSHFRRAGTVKLHLKINDAVRNRVLYTHTFIREMRDVFLISATDEVSREDLDKVYADSEKTIIKHHLKHYLAVAALHIMSRRRTLAKYFAPAMAERVGHKKEMVSAAAAAALCRLGPAAKLQIGLLKKLERTADDPHVRDNAKKAIKCLTRRKKKK